jgi:hypothetical protein
MEKTSESVSYTVSVSRSYTYSVTDETRGRKKTERHSVSEGMSVSADGPLDSFGRLVRRADPLNHRLEARPNTLIGAIKRFLALQ